MKAILYTTTLISVVLLAGCANLQERNQRGNAVYSTERLRCDQDKAVGRIKTELDMAKCNGTVLTKAMNEAEYPFPELVQQRIALEYEVAEKLDRKQITPAKAEVMRQQIEAYVMQREGELVQQKMGQQQAQSNAMMGGLVGAAMINKTIQPASSPSYNTTCIRNGVFTNCSTQ